MASLKRLVRLVEDINYNPYNYGLLLNIDRYGAMNDAGIDPFKTINPMTGTIESEDETRWLRTVIFSSYILEMYFAYAKGKKKIYIDTKYWATMIEQKVPEKERLSFSKLYNLFNDIHVDREAKLSSMVDIMLPILYEQMELQTTYVASYVRFFKIYANNHEINTIFKERKGISLKRFVALSWVALGYLSKKDKQVIPVDDFMDFLSHTIVQSDEVEAFFILISSTRDQFQDRYFQMRKKTDGTWYSYEEREAFDKGLPKVSYFYPFINNEDATYSLISFTAFKQFMKLRSLYRTMTEEFTDIEFKSIYAGPLFEDYVRSLTVKYEEFMKLGGTVGGNLEYSPKKGLKYDEPDVIYDAREYLLTIECKSTPFSLNLLKDREPESLIRIKDDIEKSIKNIKRYVDFKYPDGIDRRVVKILVYYDVPHLALGMLISEVRKYVTVPDFYITDIETLELLLMDNLGSIPKVLDAFRKDHIETQRDLNSYLRDHVDMSTYDIESERILKELVEHEIGLPIPGNREKKNEKVE